ncbi:hypothetical protein SAMN04487943_103209 [Gracilibacillus orientalis]|uniref:Uncharacterized protein n=1 Tax=Gracilibacillus orientalis TaxID=334253 RepID=A0A1I4JW16_9BACI|nr:hypothetical protein [Gracilibacillus orientalis]SFL70769.1 hypothetical protein SAMN04487943_103209 [Gracilibacillus orientalis]
MELMMTWVIVYSAKTVMYVRSQIWSGWFKNRYSSNIPTGNGTNTMNHIGAPKVSVSAPNETTEKPMTIDCQIAISFVINLLPKK